MEKPNNPKNSNFIEELKKASQEIEGMEDYNPPTTRGALLKRRGEGGGGVGVPAAKGERAPQPQVTEEAKKIEQDFENHLSEVVAERKRLEEIRKKIQERFQFVINLENRIRRVLSDRKKIDEELGKMKDKENF